MELPRINKGQMSSYLDGFKSRMGFSHEDDRQASRRRNHDIEYEDERDYGEYAYADDYDDYEDDVEGEYYAEEPLRPSDRVASRKSGLNSPRLVSMEDVRARTTVPESLHRNPLPPRRVSSSDLRGDRTMVDAGLSTHANTPNARGYAARNQERSESLGSIFEPTDVSMSTAELPLSSVSVQESRRFAGSENAAEVAANRIARPTPAPESVQRAITLIRPTNYGEAENVVDGLKQGDAVVIALVDTPEALSKRILDFAFGAACALGAQVDCVGSKVFVLTIGTGLSQAEKSALQKQGVL